MCNHLEYEDDDNENNERKQVYLTKNYTVSYRNKIELTIIVTAVI